MSFLDYVFFSILPAGTVKDEGVFFVILGILTVLVAIAIMLRKRRVMDDD